MISAPAPRPTTPSRDDKVPRHDRGRQRRRARSAHALAGGGRRRSRSCAPAATAVRRSPTWSTRTRRRRARHRDAGDGRARSPAADPQGAAGRAGGDGVHADAPQRRGLAQGHAARRARLRAEARGQTPASPPRPISGARSSDKVKALGARARERRRRLGAPAGPTPAQDQTRRSRPCSASRRRTAKPSEQKFTLRAPSSVPPRLLAIGSSTGGPQALLEVLKPLGPLFARMPVVITQHMPATFTAILAEHIQRATGVPTREARDGEAITAGRIYVAPGGRHLVFARTGDQLIGQLSDARRRQLLQARGRSDVRQPGEAHGPRGFWRSCSPAWAPTAPTAAARSRRPAAGPCWRRNEATSVVWGMPGATANAGVCSAVLPLPQIAPKILHFPLTHQGRVMSHEFEFFRRYLKDKSGLVLTPDKQYLLESRLMPVARKAGIGSLASSPPSSDAPAPSIRWPPPSSRR